MEKQTKVLIAECKYCGYKIESIYPNQLSFNLGIHEGNCSQNPKNNKEVKK